MDDVMNSHVKPKVIGKFKEWMNHNYGKNGELKANRGKVHEYLGMTFYVTEKGMEKLRWATILKG